VINMNPATETIVTATKVTTALDHLKNNRIEYLLVLILSHFLGITEKLIGHANGVCF
jgi:hypothetical protein